MGTEARRRLVGVTGDLLRSRGYYGTSLKEILDRSGSPRGSLYYYFPGGKEELVLEALLEEVDRVTKALSEILRTANNPVEGVRRYYAAAAQELQSSDFRLGCPVAPVVLDAVASSAALEAACREALAEWEEILRRRFEQAGIVSQRARSLAALAVSALEGALLVARACRDTTSIETVADEVTAAIEAAMVGEGAATKEP